MRMGQGVRTGLGHGGITCVLQTQFSSFFFFEILNLHGVYHYSTEIWQQRSESLYLVIIIVASW